MTSRLIGGEMTVNLSVRLLLSEPSSRRESGVSVLRSVKAVIILDKPNVTVAGPGEGPGVPPPLIFRPH